MQVVDTSLDDIQFMLNPKYTNDQIEHIDENVHALTRVLYESCARLCKCRAQHLCVSAPMVPFCLHGCDTGLGHS